jgi:hypothetical protein
MFANSGSIQALLSAPNPDDPLAENIAKHWKSDEAEAVATGLYLNSTLGIFHFIMCILVQSNRSFKSGVQRLCQAGYNLLKHWSVISALFWTLAT